MMHLAHTYFDALLTDAQRKVVCNTQDRSASMLQKCNTICSTQLHSCRASYHMHVKAISRRSGSCKSIPLLLTSAELSEKLWHPAALSIPCLDLNHLHTPLAQLQLLKTVCAAMYCMLSTATSPFMHVSQKVLACAAMCRQRLCQCINDFLVKGGAQEMQQQGVTCLAAAFSNSFCLAAELLSAPRMMSMRA